jgi:hypothetical protein
VTGRRHREPAPAAPGVVKVRLAGEDRDAAAVAAILAASPAVEVLTGPDAYDAGARLYLTVRVDPAAARLITAETVQLRPLDPPL